LKITDWSDDVTIPVATFQRFGGTSFLHHQHRRCEAADCLCVPHFTASRRYVDSTYELFRGFSCAPCTTAAV